MNSARITGTFIDEITYDIPSSNWGEQEWIAELDHMQAIGIDTVIFIRGGFGNKTVYPSEAFHTLHRYDLAKLIFEETTRRGMKVIMGMYISTLFWNDGDAVTEIKQNRLFVKEVLERYGDYPSFYGWYIPQETCEDVLNICDVFRGLSSLCKDNTPEKPVMISPYFKTPITYPDSPLTLEQNMEAWDAIFSKCGKDIDICAFQDGTAPIGQMSDYYRGVKQLCDRYQIRHWVNTETFERDVRCMYYPIPFEDLKQKLALHQEYAEKVITFEFSHFLSPQSIYPSARNLNKLYKAYFHIG